MIVSSAAYKDLRIEGEDQMKYLAIVVLTSKEQFKSSKLKTEKSKNFQQTKVPHGTLTHLLREISEILDES